MARSKGVRRYYRTVLLGTAALGTMVWVAVDQFNVPWRDMREAMLLTLLVVAVVIALAALCASLWLGLRKLLQSKD